MPSMKLKGTHFCSCYSMIYIINSQNEPFAMLLLLSPQLQEEELEIQEGRAGVVAPRCSGFQMQLCANLGKVTDSCY